MIKLDDRDLRPEYEIDYTKVKPNRFVTALATPVIENYCVVIDPSVALQGLPRIVKRAKITVVGNLVLSDHVY